MVQIITWHDPGYKSLSEPMMVSLPMHIGVFRPQWIDEEDNDAYICAYVDRWACPVMVYDSLYNVFSIAVAFHDLHVIAIKNALYNELLHLGCFPIQVLVSSIYIYTYIYRQVSNIRCNLVGNKIVDHPDVVGASPVGAAPTTSSFSTEHLASLDWAMVTARWDEKHLSLGIRCVLY